MRKNTRKSAAKAAIARQTEGIDVLAELAALKAMTVPELQGKWRVMFGELTFTPAGGVMDYYTNDRGQWDLMKLTPKEYYNYLQTGIYPLPVYKKE